MKAKSLADVRGEDCPLCREYPRWNADTLAAFREADEELSLVRRTGKGRWKSYGADTLAQMWKE